MHILLGLRHNNNPANEASIPNKQNNFKPAPWLTCVIFRLRVVLKANLPTATGYPVQITRYFIYTELSLR